MFDGYDGSDTTTSAKSSCLARWPLHLFGKQRQSLRLVQRGPPPSILVQDVSSIADQKTGHFNSTDITDTIIMCWANSDGATNHLVCFRHFILLHFRFQANHGGLAAGPKHRVVVAADHPLLLRQLATNVYAWDLHLLAPKFLEVEIAIWVRGFLRKEPSSTQRMDKVFDVDASNKVHHVVQRAVAIIVLTAATRNARKNAAYYANIGTSKKKQQYMLHF